MTIYLRLRWRVDCLEALFPMRLSPLSHILPYFLHCIFDRLTLHLGNGVRRIQRTMIAMAMMVKTCPTAPTVGEHSPPRQLSYVSFRGSGRLAFQHLRYHLLLSRNAIPVGPRPSHRFYPVRRRSICHRLAAQSRSLGFTDFHFIPSCVAALTGIANSTNFRPAEI